MPRAANKKVLSAVQSFEQRYCKLVDDLVGVVMASGNRRAIHVATGLETTVRPDLRRLKESLQDDEDRVSQTVPPDSPSARRPRRATLRPSRQGRRPAE